MRLKGASHAQSRLGQGERGLFPFSSLLGHCSGAGREAGGVRGHKNIPVLLTWLCFGRGLSLSARPGCMGARGWGSGSGEGQGVSPSLYLLPVMWQGARNYSPPSPCCPCAPGQPCCLSRRVHLDCWDGTREGCRSHAPCKQLWSRGVLKTNALGRIGPVGGSVWGCLVPRPPPVASCSATWGHSLVPPATARTRLCCLWVRAWPSWKRLQL